MCGIAGLISQRRIPSEKLREHAKRMGDSIAHRGPDDEGFWVDEDVGLALAHRRLAVVDLSESGNQPMVSQCGNYIMIYNGEVYNAKEIQAEIPGLRLRGTSDSEVILEAISRWGVSATVSKLIGMFAIAIWNRKNNSLTLIRDRLGIKPIYWSHANSNFLFGSELKALTAHPDCPTELNTEVIPDYLRTGYITAPASIYKQIRKVKPGTFLTIDSNFKIQEECYWSVQNAYTAGNQNRFYGGDEEAINQLDTLLQDSISRRMISDVPIGAFLSGGIDSSTVAAIMQSASNTPVRTFSIGFDLPEFNEAQYAAEIAKHIGTDHTELYVSSSDALNTIPDLVGMFDEPFADASQIPTYMLSKLTKEHVTVSLSGDGGDELFVGYDRYFTASKYRSVFNCPKPFLKTVANLIGLVDSEKIKNYVPGRFQRGTAKNKRQRIISAMTEGSEAGLYRTITSHHPAPHEFLAQNIHSSATDDIVQNINFDDRFAMFQYIDMLTYLPDDILTKVDRASMAVSLEARVPIIDHRLVEFAWTLPETMKVRNGQGKWLLRQVLTRYVPEHMFERPKKGFSVPIGKWLRAPLRDWAEDLLSENNLASTGIFNKRTVRKIWQEHLTEECDWQHILWNILTLQAWALTNKVG